jgi:hypothetical protein
MRYAQVAIYLIASKLQNHGAAEPPDVVFRALPWLDLRVSVHLVWRTGEQRPLVEQFRNAVLNNLP